MPDPIAMAKALGCAAAAAAVLVLLCGWPWRAPSAVRVKVGWVLGVAAGVYLGCRILDLWPHWPPREDQDRFLIILLPAVLLVELIAALPRMPVWLAWGFRVLIAAAAARVLLHGSVYVTNLPGASARWSPGETRLWLASLSISLVVAWVLLALFVRRRPGIVLPTAMALTLVAASLTVMLSGYATGGQLGLPLAGALGGAGLASLALRKTEMPITWVGPAVVGLFGLLTIGHFFGQLTLLHAILLFAAPLCCWLPELPYIHRLGPKLKAATSVAVVILMVGLVVMRAQRAFVAEMNATSTSDPNDTSEQDYMQLGR